MAEGKGTNVIDFRKLAGKIYSRRKLFYTKVWPITFILSCIYIVSIPRYYDSDAKLVPELEGAMGMGGIGSLASSFGLDLGNMQSSDAISPMLYPDLMEDNGFVTKLFNIHVKSSDGEVDTDYYDYLKNYQKSPWWGFFTKWVKGIVKLIMPKKQVIGPMGGEGEKNPYWLSQDDEGLAEAVRGNISFSIDKQTFVISVSTRAQDPLVAKILADSVQEHLQQFVTDYRTNKARIDVKHYQQLLEEATFAYKQSCEDYVQMTDANSNIVLNKFKVEQENMEKDMQLKYTALQTIATQLQMASAKVQERTPAFTVIKGAVVAQKPAGPKRMIFVLGMLMLVTVGYVFWILRTDLKNILLNNE